MQRNPIDLSGYKDILTPAEVGRIFRVDPKTVTRWAKAGKLTWFRTLGNQRRYYKSEVDTLLNGQDHGVTAQPFTWPKHSVGVETVTP
ncbi:MAG: hypothetical protein JWQ95_2102, partial [Sphaerisporangium sp.]|nr:hypothetical protein [Sphaerisporangium sp.]